MREIKFRGFNRNDKKWVYGYLYIDDKYCQIFVEDGYAVIVDIKSVGQYTGRKDINGKNIYEGDIVKTGTNYIEDDNVIIWNDSLSAFGIKNSHANFLPIPDDCEVIGNIYQNTELLK